MCNMGHMTFIFELVLVIMKVNIHAKMKMLDQDITRW